MTTDQGRAEHPFGDLAAHDAGYLTDDAEETEALTDACTHCGAVEGEDGWTWHASDCHLVVLSAEAKARLIEKLDEFDRKVIRVGF